MWLRDKIRSVHIRYLGDRGPASVSFSRGQGFSTTNDEVFLANDTQYLIYAEKSEL